MSKEAGGNIRGVYFGSCDPGSIGNVRARRKLKDRYPFIFYLSPPSELKMVGNGGWPTFRRLY
mgnify:FL=1